MAVTPTKFVLEIFAHSGRAAYVALTPSAATRAIDHQGQCDHQHYRLPAEPQQRSGVREQSERGDRSEEAVARDDCGAVHERLHTLNPRLHPE
jgi:hypothetical protein